MHFRRPDLRPVLFLIAALLASAPVGAQVMELGVEGELVPSSVVLAEDVGDPLFSFFLAVLDNDQYGSLGFDFFDSLLTANPGSKIPYELVERMERLPLDGTPESRVLMRFNEAVDVPIPYSILGYRPGRFRTTREIWMTHWRMPQRNFRVRDEDGEEFTFVAKNAHLFVIDQGTIEMDVDGWLDRMLGSKLDDVSIAAFFIFEDDGVRVSLGMGYSNKGKGRTGAFNFTENKTLFPAPKHYLAVGREMRTVGEHRLKLHQADAGRR